MADENTFDAFEGEEPAFADETLYIQFGQGYTEPGKNDGYTYGLLPDGRVFSQGPKGQRFIEGGGDGARQLDAAAVNQIKNKVLIPREQELVKQSGSTAIVDLSQFNRAIRNTSQQAQATPQRGETIDPAGTAMTKRMIQDRQRDAYVKAQKQDLRRTMGPMALVGGMGAAINLLGAYAPKTFGTVQDQYAAEELERLERTAPGLSAAERKMMQRELMDPTRAAATESRQRLEAREAAGQGTRTSAGALMRGRRLEADNLRKAQQFAGMKISQAHMQKAAEQLRKKEQLIAYQGERQREALGATFDTATQIAGMAGRARAGRKLEVMDTGKMHSSLRHIGTDNPMTAEQFDELQSDLEMAGRYSLGGKPSARRVRDIFEKHGVESTDPRLIEEYSHPNRMSEDLFTGKRRRDRDPYGFGEY